MPQVWHGEAYDYPADPESGATRVRLTTSLMHHCNVYCEQGYGSPDGRRVAILRSFNADPTMIGHVYAARVPEAFLESLSGS